MSNKLKSVEAEMLKGELITYQEFLERKVEQCITLWRYGKNTTEQFKISMLRLGYDEEVVQESLDDYFNT
tara:strand:- start:1029 stop:1238 length:210 start_codon:yes stop_codon:yes gene_type:complete